LTQKIPFRRQIFWRAGLVAPARPFRPAHSLQWALMATESNIPALIRSFTRQDQAACKALYEQGLIGGKISDNDTGFDIDGIEAAYMKNGNHFWVAEAEGKVVGMIGVQHHDEGTGEIRRLRVHPDYRRRGIGGALVETAVRFCREQNYLKVTLDTFMERDPAIRLFEQFKFRHYRTKTFGEKELVYFYLDLYATDQRDPHAHQAE
jgi:ribosomal protein S18 acetylase RimI-like enzyme